MIIKLEDILELKITGEWGTDCEDNFGVNILRTTNFTNIGEINYLNVIKRKIEDKKIETKRLIEGDIILEKSGGSDNIPVGRVVFCDSKINENIYLCNNFTQALRVNKSKALSKYVFYFLHYQHKKGFTELLQNKTTGIRNLQLKEYMKMKITIPLIEQQKKIVNLIDKVDLLIKLRNKQIEKLDLLIKSRFVEMFGDPMANIMGWSVVYISSVLCGKISNGFFAKREEYADDGNVAVLGVAYVVNRMYSECINLPKANGTESDIKKYGVKYGDVLFCRSSLVADGIGKASIVPKDVPKNTLFECHVIRLPLNLDKCVPEFLQVLTTTDYFRRQIISQSNTATMTTISQDGILKSKIILPPIELQNKFYDFVHQVDKLKFELQKNLNELTTLYNALMQKYFG